MNLDEKKRARSRSVLSTVVVLVLALRFLCGDTQAGSSQAILSLLPEQSEIAGWQGSSERMLYPGEALFDYLNGGAETFFDHGFKQALVREYGKGAFQIVLDIFEMSSSTDAREIFQKRASADYQRIAIGEDGRVGDYYLIFYKGPFFVAVTGLSMEPEVIAGIESIGRAVAKRIP
jgi:hypothetical protein